MKNPKFRVTLNMASFPGAADTSKVFGHLLFFNLGATDNRYS